MSLFKFGDILIINFIFSESAGSKRRPVLVLKDTQDGDLLVCKITSKVHSSQFDLKILDWEQTNLLSPSIIRFHKIQTISSQLTFGKIGQLTLSDKKFARQKFSVLFQSL